MAAQLLEGLPSLEHGEAGMREGCSAVQRRLRCCAQETVSSEVEPQL